MNGSEDEMRGGLARRIVIERVGGRITDTGVRSTEERSEITEEGIQDIRITQIGFADCGCLITDTSQLGGVCRCGKVLCREHFYHCERCGAGLCSEEKRELGGHIYCARCRVIVVLNKILGL